MIKKIIEDENGQMILQFTPEELNELGWCEGDTLEWVETEEGITLMKTKNNVIKINASLDDEAFKVGDFIQELGKIQEQYYDALWEKAKANNWIEGMEEEQAKDWLFDYVFNGWNNDKSYFEEMFSEYVKVPDVEVSWQ